MVQKIKDWLSRLFTVGFILSLLAVLVIQVMVFYQLSGLRSSTLPAIRGERIGVLTLEGGIMNIENELEILKRYRESDAVKAVLLEVDSPGGLVGPSQELSEAVADIREAGKPVVSSIRTVGASGAYYVASSSDTIVANPGSMVGSIGVIIQFMKFKELMNKVGVDYRVVKSGRFKDLGSPFRDMEESERELIRNLSMVVYEQFVEHILEQRPGSFTRNQLEELADGRIFTGRQALSNDLIDSTGTRQDAIEIAGRAAGLGDDPNTVNFSRRNVSFLQESVRSFFGAFKWMRPEQPPFRLLYRMPEVAPGS